MNHGASRSNGSRLTVAGLTVAAVGMILEMVTGSTLYPTLTGPIVLVAGAGLVAFRPGRWTSYVGLGIPLVLLVGLAISAVLSPAFVTQLTDLSTLGLAVGSALHVAGLIAAVIGGVAMVRRHHAPSGASAGAN